MFFLRLSFVLIAVNSTFIASFYDVTLQNNIIKEMRLLRISSHLEHKPEVQTQ